MDFHRPNAKINWLHVSAVECTASENNEAEPVKNHPMSLATAFAALLNRFFDQR